MVKKVLTQLLLTGALLLVSLLITHKAAHAATDGRLIDDPVWDDTSTMSATDVQNFLNQFPNSCIKNYSDQYPNDYFNYSGSASAATIINRASTFWNLNPRVILAKLQQEQSLVTGSAGCASWRYTGAMGFNCPEGSSCPANPDNAGFSRQVMRASWLLKISKERANGNFGWEDPADNNWNYGGPMTQGYRKRCGSCAVIYYDGWNNVGGTTLYIETGATASLYYYTPHVPSSFDNIYEAWWGSTYAGSWNTESLDGSINSINSNDAVLGGSPNAIQFGSNLYTFYYDATKHALRMAYADNSGWHFSILDGAGGVAGSSSATVGQDVTSIVYNNALHIFYYDLDNGNLRHAWTSDGTNWSFENLDGAGGANGRLNADVGRDPSITQLGGNMHMFYYDATNKSLRHAWWDNNSSSWFF